MTLLAGSITLLYLMIVQDFRINVDFDAHLWHYLVFTLPDAIQSNKVYWLDGGIYIIGDGIQGVVFFICLMTINRLATMHNVGLISQECSADARFLTPGLVVSRLLLAG